MRGHRADRGWCAVGQWPEFFEAWFPPGLSPVSVLVSVLVPAPVPVPVPAPVYVAEPVPPVVVSGASVVLPGLVPVAAASAL
ncbi:hypothetical protein GCM10010342_57240 [Streptomyces anulatus]|nr:hypothetical protein GCM10010342_57240 [Streptomyces anulatus]